MTFDPTAALANAARVRELDELATPGPWFAESSANAYYRLTAISPERWHSDVLADFHHPQKFVDGKRVVDEARKAEVIWNMTFAEAARTGWPETADMLVAACEELVATNKAYEEVYASEGLLAQKSAAMEAERDQLANKLAAVTDEDGLRRLKAVASIIEHLGEEDRKVEAERDAALAKVRELEADKAKLLANARTALEYVYDEAVRAKDKRIAELELVAIEARELIGEVDATGVIPQANIAALRALLWRADVKSGKVKHQ